MKNVLLTTTALVAIAGAAAADISWTGSGSVEYDVNAKAFSMDADIDFKYTQELNNGASAYLSYGADIEPGISWDALPVVGLDTSYGSISAGAIDNVNGADDADANDAFVDGMIVGDALNQVGFGAQTHLVRANTSVGGINVAASTDDGGDTIAANVSGSMGTVDFALYYGKSTAAAATDFEFPLSVDTVTREGTSLGFTAGTSFSGFDVNVAYASGSYSGLVNGGNAWGIDSGTSMGVAVSYALTDAVTVSASTARNTYDQAALDDLDDLDTFFLVAAEETNTVNNTQTAVGIAYAANDVTASLDYDVDAKTYEAEAGYTMALSADTTAVLGVAYDGTDATFSVDVTHMMGDASLYAGYDSDGANAYAGVVYDLGAGAEAYAYYSDNTAGTADELGPQEWSQGTIVGVSVSF